VTEVIHQLGDQLAGLGDIGRRSLGDPGQHQIKAGIAAGAAEAVAVNLEQVR